MADPTIDWGNTNKITIPQSYLTFVSGTFYRLDTDAFRLKLKELESGAIEGATYPKTHTHNTEYTVAGVTYARSVEILSPYTVEFEDGQYSVELINSNNNIWDVGSGILVQNQVQVIPTNSGGLIVVTTGSGLDAAQDAKLTNIDTRATATDRAIRNRYVINRTTGMIDIYSDNGLTILDSVPIYEDQDAATPVGSTITRIDRREKIDL